MVSSIFSPGRPVRVQPMFGDFPCVLYGEGRGSSSGDISAMKARILRAAV